jgi:hypothetical protein
MLGNGSGKGNSKNNDKKLPRIISRLTYSYSGTVTVYRNGDGTGDGTRKRDIIIV